MITTAFTIASKSFEGKLDKSGEPYIKHCNRVLEYLLKSHPHIIEDIQCIALLHDLFEDCPEWNEKSLSCFFSERVINGIVALTHKKEQTYEQYISQVINNPDAVLVKVCDLKDNMDITRLDSIEEQDITRLKKYHEAFRRLYPLCYKYTINETNDFF